MKQIPIPCEECGKPITEYISLGKKYHSSCAPTVKRRKAREYYQRRIAENK